MGDRRDSNNWGRARPTLFQAAPREKWRDLPPAVKRLHSVQGAESFSGLATVTRGRSRLARFAAWFFRFPESGDQVPLTITKTRTATGEIWERDFDGRVFRSYLTPSGRPYHYRERFWAFTYEQELPVIGGCLHLPVRRGWFLGVPLPSALLPGSESREFEAEGRFHFDVGLYAPLGGRLIVRYRGAVRPDLALGEDRARDGAEMTAGSREHEHVPDGILIGQAVPNVKNNADGV